VVGVDEHDVVEFGYRPVGAELFAIDKVNRVFRAQALKTGPVALLLEQRAGTGVQLMQWQG
jgi:hypothetical protein